MNRKIKFRVYNKKAKEWVHEPGYEVNLFGETILLGAFMPGVKIEDLDDCDVLQFSGVKDKGGKEIYEGDIIESEIDVCSERGEFGDYINKDKFIVEFSGGVFGRRINSYAVKPPLTGTNHWTVKKYNVIGNIYDNPELIR